MRPDVETNLLAAHELGPRSLGLLKEAFQSIDGGPIVGVLKQVRVETRGIDDRLGQSIRTDTIRRSEQRHVVEFGDNRSRRLRGMIVNDDHGVGRPRLGDQRLETLPQPSLALKVRNNRQHSRPPRQFRITRYRIMDL